MTSAEDVASGKFRAKSNLSYKNTSVQYFIAPSVLEQIHSCDTDLTPPNSC